MEPSRATDCPDLSRELAHAPKLVAGVDEVGRGPWAGPVVAAAVILDPRCFPDGIRDSKAVPKMRREEIAEALGCCAMIGIGRASVEEIDALNILQASHLAMRRAVAALPQKPGHLLIDGNAVPRGLPCPSEAIIKGDALCLSIAAASIVAKVARDAEMVALAQHFPGYGWERNAGYGTKEHQEALNLYGTTPYHRRSFRQVHNILCKESG